ncbi:MAG: hypothetical protein RL483_888 [Pseudomonadota bacterium]|jgi:1-acyl-sn-glycerol-3-phosphate acyltransferase
MSNPPLVALVRSLVFVAFQAISVTIWGSLFVLLAPLLSPTNRYRFAMRWPAMSSWAAQVLLGLQVRVQGQQNLKDACQQPVIVCSKHQSAWETLFLPSYLPRPLCFVFKRELLRIPFFGWGIGLLPMIHVDRAEGLKAYRQIAEQARGRQAEGRWITFFPEGTRTRPGQRVKYKTGAARLALELNSPILPIAHNAGRLWPRNALVKQSGTIDLVIGSLIWPQPGETPDQLMRRVEEFIEETVRGLS